MTPWRSAVAFRPPRSPDASPPKSGPVITAEEMRRGWARTDTVRVKLGRNPTIYDVLREFGDESAEAGLLGAPGGASG